MNRHARLRERRLLTAAGVCIFALSPSRCCSVSSNNFFVEAVFPNKGNGQGRGDAEHTKFQRILRGNDARYRSIDGTAGSNNGAGACQGGERAGGPGGPGHDASTAAAPDSANTSTTCPTETKPHDFGNDFGSKMPGRGGASISGSTPLFARGGAAAAAARPGYRTAPQPTQSGISSSQQQQRYSSVAEHESANRAETKEAIDAFLTRDSRNSFITRVYAILSAQLAVTALSIFAFGTHPEWTRFMLSQSGRLVPMLSLAVSTIAWFFVCGSESARRTSPLKWQLLAAFTAGEAVTVGFISSFYKLKSVISAMSATAAATLSITLYTMMQNNPKYDLSQWGAGLASAGVIFIVYGIIHLLEIFGVLPQGFLPYSEAIYSFFGATLFSFYLAYHTRLIVSGKHTKYQMNEKDYVFGAMSLYNDVINLFLYLLRLIGEDRD